MSTPSPILPPSSDGTTARRLVDVRAVGTLLGLSERTVYRLADRGSIPFGVKLGSARRWDVSEIERFIREGCKPARPTRRP